MALVPKTNTDGIGYIGATSTLDGTVFENGTKYMADTAASKITSATAATLASSKTYAEDQVKATGFTDPGASTGYSFAVLDAESRVGELALDLAGSVPKWVLDRWAERLGLELTAGKSAFQREALVSAFKQRRGQVIGTAGKAVVCLRFDHGWNNFVATVLPLLRERSLPATQMVNPATQTDSLNGNVSYASIQSMWLNDGVEVANHCQSHGSATTKAEIYHHVVDALEEIQANLPHSPVEAFIPGGEVGTGTDSFAGSSTASFYETTAGPMVLQRHAAVFGYMPGMYRALPQDMNLGGAHVSGDTWTLANLTKAVDDTIAEGAATTFMFHPALVGGAGGIAVADLTALLDHIKAKRDAGQVEVLTMTGSLLANPHTTARHDLIANGDFRAGLTPWINTTGWTTTTTNGVPYATTTTGGLIRQFEGSRHVEQLWGSNRELYARFRAPAGAVVRLDVTSSSGTLNTFKEVTLPASPNWVEVRQPFSIPNNAGALTFNAGRVSGGAVDMTDIRAQTI